VPSKKLFAILLALSLLAACNLPTATQPAAHTTAVHQTAEAYILQTLTSPPPSQTPLPATSTTTSQPPAPPPTPTATLQPPTELPTQSPTAAITPLLQPTSTATLELPSGTARERITTRMQTYGDVQDAYLSDAYWQQLEARLARCGSTEDILTLEFHGDSYTMYDGRYSMNPQAFRAQVEYLMQQDYHFATLHEVEGFVQGWLALPSCSVILTTDVSDEHAASLLSIASTFTDLEAQYGYSPHMIAFIWTGAMASGVCWSGGCWEDLNEALETGYFTFGTHSYSHQDFGQITPAEQTEDLQRSISDMQAEMGLTPYALAWPFETCSAYPDTISTLGITLAWGGVTKPMEQNFTSWLDPRPLCLPRMLPPNIEGISMRPPGYTLQQMLEMP
jgi:hypothetical protein